MAEHASKSQVAAVVSFYMVAAMVMVLVNKAVLDSSPDLPLSLLFIQMSMAVVLIHLTNLLSNTRAGSRWAGKVEIPTIDLATAKKLLPIILINIVGLTFNTLCLRDVDASFFQIARGLVLPLTIAVSTLHTRKPPSLQIIFAATIVTGGFFLGVSPSALYKSLIPSASLEVIEGASLTAASTPTTGISVAVLSLIYGFMASVMIAVHVVLVKYALSHVGNSSMKLAYWTNFGSAVIALPIIFLNGEVAILVQLLAKGGQAAQTFIAGSAVTSVFGFLLCLAGLLSIKVTSPITHMFSSAARSVIQTMLAVILFNDVISAQRGLSILVITVGTLYFTWVKSASSAAATPPKMASSPPIDIEKQAKA